MNRREFATVVAGVTTAALIPVLPKGDEWYEVDMGAPEVFRVFWVEKWYQPDYDYQKPRTNVEEDVYLLKNHEDDEVLYEQLRQKVFAGDPTVNTFKFDPKRIFKYDRT